MWCDLTPVFYDCREVTARKEHECCECSAPIRVGERHYLAKGKWDGDFSTYRQHIVCGDACMLIRDDMQDGECIPFGHLKGWLECFEPRPGDERDEKLMAMVREIEAREKESPCPA